MFEPVRLARRRDPLKKLSKIRSYRVHRELAKGNELSPSHNFAAVLSSYPHRSNFACDLVKLNVLGSKSIVGAVRDIDTFFR